MIQKSYLHVKLNQSNFRIFDSITITVKFLNAQPE